MRSVCATSTPFACVTNHSSCRRAVVVLPEAVSCQVMEGAAVWVVESLAVTMNWGSVLVDGGIGVGFRQGTALTTVICPLITVSPGCVDVFVLSQVWFVGVGKVAPTNRLKRVVPPVELLNRVAGSGGVVLALEMSVAN